MAKTDGWLVKLFLNEDQAKPFFGVLPEYATDVAKTEAKRQSEAKQLGVTAGKYRDGVIDTGTPAEFKNRSIRDAVRDLDSSFVLTQARCYTNPKRASQKVLLLAYHPDGKPFFDVPTDFLIDEIEKLCGERWTKVFTWDNPEGKMNTINCTP